MGKGVIVIVLSVVCFFLFLLGLVVHSAIKDKREENEKLRKKLAMANYVNEVERAMKEGKRLTDPEAIRRFHAALDARRDPDK
jgi:Na+-transporting methylmalonyl-CoA/oxaloacetate decarboxylase gamma subunit